MVKVVVVGAGIMGICSAYQIKDMFPHFDVTVVAEKFSPNNTSDGAAGLWRAVNVGNTPRELIKKWSDATLLHVLDLLKTPDAPKMGLSKLHGYLLSKKHLKSSDWEEQAPNCHVLTELELKQFPSKIKSGCSYSTVMIESSYFLPYLSNQFVENGGKMLTQKINNIHSLFETFDIVINCCGLGARELVNDKDVYPVRGQVIRVKAPWIKEFIYHIDVDENGRTCYIFPNQKQVILGGTKQVNNANLQVEERDWIMKSTQEFIPSLKHAEFVCDWVGLRPARSNVRLEKEIVNINLNGVTKKGIIIHNYGHGANGITLSWGCCENVVKLVEECITDTNLMLHSKM